MYKLYAHVILNNNSKSTDRIYTYGVGEEFENRIQKGKRVKVNFGRNKNIVDALVISLSCDCSIVDSKLKPIIDIIDEEVVIKEEMIRIIAWMRERYICKYSDVVKLMLPAMMKFENNTILKIIDSGFCEVSLNKHETAVMELLKSGNIKLEKLKNLYAFNDLYLILDNLKAKQIIEIENREYDNQVVFEKIIRLKENKPIEEYSINGTEKQVQVINYLKVNGKVNIKKVTDDLGISTSIINNLVKKDVICIEKALYENNDAKDSSLGKIYEKIVLNEEQKNASDRIINSENKIFLLQGVTGSGKTEVYMDIIDHYQRENKQSIVLVPEISLTTQTIERFQKRFGSKIAVFHSKLSKKERFIQWSKVHKKEASVIIGARSALFAPVCDLGAIIIDEEHEESYKSSTSPKYDTIEVAIKMSYLFNSKLVLGSATPSLNTYYLVEKKQIELVEIKKRVRNLAMPDVSIIDMAQELDKGNGTIISEALYDSMKLSLKNEEQIILFLNKRGYSGFISCKKCGYVAKCDRCDVSMTYHLKDNMLHCHYCGRTKKMLNVCPECGNGKIEQFGAGTQHVEKLIKHLFPEAYIERMDVDSMRNLSNYQGVYERFKNKKIDILIGTQMLAKGLDFPDVTTVGVISADTILNLPFFNSGEKTYQLLTQVGGRAGRGYKRGRVFIQTYEPENFIINAAKNNDYSLFVKEELALRKEFAFPPFINIINICLISRNEDFLKKIAFSKYEELKNLVNNFTLERSLLLYKPVPHNIYKINDEYRINLYMKCSNHCINELKKIIRSVYMSKDIENIKVSININTDTV